MNKVSKRSWIVLIGASFVLLGLLLFLVRYITQSSEWVSFPGNPHLYSGINPSIGSVVDRDGELLLNATEERIYAEELTTRLTTIHLLGDRDGYIEAPLLSYHTKNMIEFDPVTGLKQAEDAKTIAQLTLNNDIQRAAWEALNGYKGTIGVYNYKTGEILCAVTSPSYDPDDVPDIAGDTTGKYEGAYVNRFFRSAYTPGSVFKALTAVAALECLEKPEELTFLCEGETIIDGEKIVCTGYHGWQTLQEALTNSCNVAFGELSVMIGADNLDLYVEKAGIRSNLTFDGITTASGKFDLTDAGDGTLAWAGIGQHTDLINPCQYMVFMGMLANGGEAAQPYLMNRITSGDEVRYEAETVMLDSGLKRSATDSVATMMRNNVIYGYGEWLFPGLEVCGKSGTAETVEGKENNALFSGFVLDEDYPLAFIVVVEEGGSGASVAAPIAGQVLTACVEALQP